jgi:hypothetical protein
MPIFKRRRPLPTAAYLGLTLVAAAVILTTTAETLNSRSVTIVSGMPRDEVERLLGSPVLKLNRMGGRWTLLSWVDQLWQVDVLTDQDGRVETVEC